MRTCIVILNWNGWKDTIECLESVFRLDYPDFRVVVCDNGSSDGSLEHLKRWAHGDLAVGCRNPELSQLVSPPCPKPIPYCELDCSQAQLGSICNDHSRLILIQNGGNLGFAAGNNVGLRFALGDPECQYFWILNNDTVVDPQALSALMERMRQQPTPGLCGSVIRSYQCPEVVYVVGGRKFSKWTGRSRIPPRSPGSASFSGSADFDYVEGASMFVSRGLLETIGLLEESYFLYFEEVDWAVRAQGRFVLGLSPKSIVYHKEGASIGSSQERSKRSPVSTRYMMRSKVLFTRRFWPWALPTVLLTIVIAALERLLVGDWQRARLIAASAWHGLTAPLRPLHSHSDKSTPATAS